MNDDRTDRPHRAEATEAPPIRLSAADAAAVDAVFDAAGDGRDLPVEVARRARVEAIVGLLDHYEDRLDRRPADGGDLVDRTMSLLDAAARASAGAYRFPAAAAEADRGFTAAGRGRGRRRMQDLVTLAAAVLIAVGVGWSMLDDLRSPVGTIDAPGPREAARSMEAGDVQRAMPGGGLRWRAGERTEVRPLSGGSTPSGSITLLVAPDDPLRDALEAGDLETAFRMLEARGLWQPPTPLVSPVPVGSVVPVAPGD